MSSTFASQITKPEVGCGVFVMAEGAPYVFFDGAIPVGPTGSQWAAPTSKGFAYTLKANMIDLSGGLAELGRQLSRRTGVTSPASMSVVLKDDATDFLLDLFATEKSGGNTANLSESLGYDTAASEREIEVDSTTGFASTGYLWLGPECLHYTLKTPTAFGNTGANQCTRDLFTVEDGAGNSYGDVNYTMNDNTGTAGRVISDYVRIWHNRVVRVFLYLTGPDGRAFDAAIHGDHCREIFRGTIQGDPKPLPDWQRWQLDLRSIDAILHTQIAGGTLPGMLLRVAGDHQMQIEGQTVPSGNYDLMSTMYIDDATRYLSLRIDEYADQAAFDAGTINESADYTGDNKLTIAAEGIYTFNVLIGALNGAIKTAIANKQAGADPFDHAPKLFIKKWKKGHTLYASSTGNAIYRVSFRWSADGSIGPLFQFFDDWTVTVDAFPDVQTQRFPDTQLAAYVSKTAQTISYFLPETYGILSDTPTAPGYAILGGKEIIYYTGTAAVDTSIEGIFKLTGCQRGLFGSKAQEHKATVDENYRATGEDMTLVFCAGMKTDMITAIFRFAFSTGNASHHTSYDTLSHRHAARLNPNHFDVAAIEAIRDGGFDESELDVALVLAKSKKLTEFISQLLAPRSLYMTARTNDDGDYLITIDRTLPPLESDAATTLDTSTIDMVEPAIWSSTNDQIVNEIEVAYSFDYLKGDVTKERITARDLDSQADYGVRGKLTWKLLGVDWSAGEAIANVEGWARQAFRRHGRVYDVLTINTDRTGWLLKPGDTVAITLPNAPTKEGSRGLTSRLATVLFASHLYYQPGGEPGARVSVVLEPQLRQSTYVPAADVTAYDAGTPSITVASNFYTPSNGALGNDVDYFGQADAIVIFNEGDFGTRDVRSVVSIAGNVITISSALTNCTFASGSTRVIGDDYSNANAAQKKHAHMANNATPAVLSVANTEAFRYV